MDKAKQLVLITTSFPDQRRFEGNFIAPELPHLLQNFEKVYLIPCKPAQTLPLNLPDRVILKNDLAERLGFPAKLKLLQHAASGLKARKQLSRQSLEPAFPIVRAIANFANLRMAQIVNELLKEGIENGTWIPEETIFYSYWCKYSALGIAWTKREYPNLKAVTRAHRSDLYTDHAPYGLVTGQSEIIAGMDGTFPISQDGADFLKKRFPSEGHKIHVARLGTHEPGGRASPSTDGVLRIASCSSAIPVKRLDLIFETVLYLSRDLGRRVEWIHFGDGPKLSSIRAKYKESANPNLTCEFAGNTALENILAHYCEKPVDVFINASESEGIPVSIMEATSAGIPCVAPAVGGIPELIDESSGGILVSPEAKPEELAKACLEITHNSDSWEKRSEQAILTWKQRYNATINFKRFAETLKDL